MFVRDGTQALHVLMPTTGGAGCCDVHAPRLIFDSAYTRANQSGRDDALVHISLQKKKLELPQAGSALDNALPANLAKVGHVVGDVVTGDDTDSLASRVLIRNGSCTDFAKGACWTWKGQVQRLSHVIEWSVADVPGDSLSLPLYTLTGMETGPVPTLHPIDGVVEMQVWHAPHPELPPDFVIPSQPARGGDAQHFSGYGILLTTGTTDVPAYEEDACGELLDPSKYDDDPRSSVTWSCTSAEGEYP
jgi:hypothetical protein